jgi:kynurenine formamidase
MGSPGSGSITTPRRSIRYGGAATIEYGIGYLTVPRFVELSHEIVAGMKTYPELPEPKVEVLLDYEASRERYQNQAEFYIASLHLCGNTGTYVDAPRHRYRDGVDLAGLPLARLADLQTLLIDATGAGRAIDGGAFRQLDMTGRAVLLRTDFSKHWGTPAYFSENPFLTATAADLLVSKRPAFVGIDSLNIDDTGDPSRPAHTKLLGAGIPVCEHMTNLQALPASGARLHAVPIAWVGGGTFPVRAYAIVG